MQAVPGTTRRHKGPPTPATALHTPGRELPHHPFRLAEVLLKCAGAVGATVNLSVGLCSFVEQGRQGAGMQTMSEASRVWPCSALYTVGNYASAAVLAFAQVHLAHFMKTHWTCLPHRWWNKMVFGMFVLLMANSVVWLLLVTWFNRSSSLHVLCSFGVFVSGGLSVLVGHIMLVAETCFRRRFLGEQGYATFPTAVVCWGCTLMGLIYMVVFITGALDGAEWWRHGVQGAFEISMSCCYWCFWPTIAWSVSSAERSRLSSVLKGLSWGISSTSRSSGWTPRSNRLATITDAPSTSRISSVPSSGFTTRFNGLA